MIPFIQNVGARGWGREGWEGLSFWGSEDVPELGSGVSQRRECPKTPLTIHSKWLNGEFYVR